jgi:hypothetical protein
MKGKAMTGQATQSVRLAALTVGLFLLTGCAIPQKINQVQQDVKVYRAQQDERDAYDRCTQSTLPGSMEHMECMAALAKGNATPAK